MNLTADQHPPLRQAPFFKLNHPAHRPLPFALTARSSATLATSTIPRGHRDSAHGSGLGARMEQTAQTRHGYTSRSAIGGPVRPALTASRN